MSIYVSIQKEIKDYEPKIMLGLSYRNLIYGTPALVIGLGGFTLASFCMDSQIASVVPIVLAAPFFACGFLDKEGMPYDKYLRLYISHKIRKQKLVYENLIYEKKEETTDATDPKKKKSAKQRRNRKQKIKETDEKTFKDN